MIVALVIAGKETRRRRSEDEGQAKAQANLALVHFNQTSYRLDPEETVGDRTHFREFSVRNHSEWPLQQVCAELWVAVDDGKASTTSTRYGSDLTRIITATAGVWTPKTVIPVV